MKSEPDPPMTLGAAAAGPSQTYRVVPRLSASGRARPRRDSCPCGKETSVLYWREQPVCSRCKSRAVDMVVTGTNWWATADIRGT